MHQDTVRDHCVNVTLSSRVICTSNERTTIVTCIIVMAQLIAMKRYVKPCKIKSRLNLFVQCKVNSYRGSGNGGNGGGKNYNTGTSQCCGSYPKRFPFNTGKATCCDGKISSIGSC